MNKALKIIFVGTPLIAKEVLANILQHGFTVDLVLTQPDRPAGRGMHLQASLVKQLALAHELKVLQPSSLRNNPQLINLLREMKPDIMLVVAYGLILPNEILAIPRLGCVNLHVSLLPKWRGAAPIQRAVLAGDSHSGISLMQMDEGLDTGDVLLMQSVALATNETSASLHDRLAQLGAEAVVKFLTKPELYVPVKQQTTGVSYAQKIEKSEAQVCWDEDAVDIERKIRGFNPQPGAFSYLNQELHKFWQAQVVVGQSTTVKAGTIVAADKQQLLIACGNGSVLKILEIQLAGSKRKLIEQYLTNKNNLVGNVFQGG